MSGYSAYTDGAGAAPLLPPSGPSLTESSASELWNLLLENRPVVPFNQFMLAITKHFNQVYKATLFSEEGHLPSSTTTAPAATGGYTASGSNSVPSLLNAALAATGAISDLTSDNPTISRDSFLLFLARFGGGASKYSIRDSPFDAVRQLFPTSNTESNPNLVGLAPWFHASADLPSNVEPVLQKSAQAGQGNFIVRFSGSKPSHFAMDFMGPNDSKAKKLLIVRQNEGWMKQGGQTVHPTLPVLIDNHARSNGQWLVSALSQRFKGGEAIESASSSTTTNTSLSRQPSATQGAYSTTGLENGMQGVQILDASLPNSSPALSPANSGYAAAPIIAESNAPVVAASGYAASFNPVAAPVPQPASQSGYSASFIAADSDALPASNPGTASRAASTLPPLPTTILPWNQRVLFYAAAVGDLLSLQQHCARCEGCSLTDAYGLSMIHVAAANDQPEVLKLLKSHVPETLLRSNVTRAISPAESTSLSAYNWTNRYMPYWPSKPLSEELAIANPRALCAVFNTSRALAALEEMGVQPSLLLERAPSASEHSSPLPNSVPILTQTLSAGASRYMAQ